MLHLLSLTILAFSSVLAPLEVYQPSEPSSVQDGSNLTMQDWIDLTAPMTLVPIQEDNSSKVATTTPQEDEQSSPAEATTTTPEPNGRWDELAVCESGYGGPGNWNLNTGNGYYGGLQFSLESWQWVGGTGYPHEHSREEQIKRAEILLERQGWNAWPACSRKLGWR